MHTRNLAALLLACALAGTAVAETIVVNDRVEVAPSQVDRPKRGSTMSDVEKHFGAPVNRHPTVGAPPITRWDYSNFAVFFEGDRVIDAVVTSG
jgi:outer membrane protein assembly factor BamE (lipoprotein component of BamABCDE complex)